MVAIVILSRYALAAKIVTMEQGTFGRSAEGSEGKASMLTCPHCGQGKPPETYTCSCGKFDVEERDADGFAPMPHQASRKRPTLPGDAIFVVDQFSSRSL